MNRPLKVVVIDDDREVVKVTELLLKSRGYETVVVHGGAAGLELVRGQMPDVVLLDIMMPGMDGLEVCRRLKSDERTSSVPVIFVTALDACECAETATSVGGSGFLTKPFQPTELFAMIEELGGTAP